MKFHREPYWFKPYKIGYVAVYYPISWQGFASFTITLLILVHDFLAVDKFSHSVGDLLMNFSIPAIAILLVLNITTRLKGEYPWWWKRWKKNKESV